MGTITNYLSWMNVATYVFGGLAACYLLLSRKVWASTPPLTKLVGRPCGALFFICLGAAELTPVLFSPRLTVTGQVHGFHRVHVGRGSYYFEFGVAGADSTPMVHADYFDKGFYFGDPIISDGDTLEVTYLHINGQAMNIREIFGRHSGWEYQADTKPIGPPISIVIGLAMIVGSVIGLITDIQAKPNDESEERSPTSVLGL